MAYRRTAKNLDRGARAMRALMGGEYDPVIKGDAAVTDLICDLLHYARQHKIDAGDLWRSAWNHFDAEQEGKE